MECNVRDVTVYYEEVGSGRPILMLHGWPLDHRHIMNCMEPLFVNRPGWRRIYPDLPGMGNTRGPEWLTTHDQMLEVVLAFWDQVAPGERCVVAGNSYGGYLAWGVIHQRGTHVDGALLTVPLIETDDRKKRYPKHQSLKTEPGFLEALQPDEDYLRNFLVVQTLDLLAVYRRVITAAVKDADQAFLQRIQPNHFVGFEVDALPTPFPAPALFLTGREDHVCGYREAFQILDNYPRATFAVLDCAGHVLDLEQRALFQALANDWLTRVEEYVAARTVL